MTPVAVLPALEKQLVLQPLMGELLPLHVSTVVIASVTGGAKAHKMRCHIIRVVVDVCSMQVNRIHGSGSFGDPL
jgi:hypothetical protein